MDNSIHAFLIAQQVTDRMDEATAGRTVRDVKRERQSEPRPRLVRFRRRLARRAAVDTAVPAPLRPLPPR